MKPVLDRTIKRVARRSGRAEAEAVQIVKEHRREKEAQRLARKRAADWYRRGGSLLTYYIDREEMVKTAFTAGFQSALRSASPSQPRHKQKPSRPRGRSKKD